VIILAQIIDIRDVESDCLIDAGDICVGTSLPKAERMPNMIKQMNGNPYFFKSAEIVVEVRFADTDVTFDERFEDYLRTI
jgi:hypothetical protein